MFKKIKMCLKNSFKKETDKEVINLQNAYRNGEIKEGDLSQEQVDRLAQLYDEQIAELQKAIEERKERIEKHKKKLEKGD